MSYPLYICCSEGFVEGRHIMKLRQQLQKKGYSNSFTTDEKGLYELEGQIGFKFSVKIKRNSDAVAYF